MDVLGAGDGGGAGVMGPAWPGIRGLGRMADCTRKSECATMHYICNTWSVR
ncbi:hypothetical protein P355_3717 [Burkholderia cenocepacia KC-01]|nr:hypothetical protein P355_3717 [Burkholderia cenocepacia KC-01]